jgi:hypothetical protein
MNWQKQHCKIGYTTRRDLQIQHNSHQVPMTFFTEIGK